MRTVLTGAVLALTLSIGACATSANQQEFTRTDVEAIRKTATDLSAAFTTRNSTRSSKSTRTVPCSCPPTRRCCAGGNR